MDGLVDDMPIVYFKNLMYFFLFLFSKPVQYLRGSLEKLEIRISKYFSGSFMIPQNHQESAMVLIDLEHQNITKKLLWHLIIFQNIMGSPSSLDYRLWHKLQTWTKKTYFWTLQFAFISATAIPTDHRGAKFTLTQQLAFKARKKESELWLNCNCTVR